MSGQLPVPSDDPLFHRLQGQACLQSGDPRGAVRCFQERLRFHPDSLEGLLDLGRALQAAGDPTAAADPLLYALLLHPASAEAHAAMGALLRDQGDLAGALACLEEALKRAPRDPALLLKQGRIQADLLHFEAAAASFREAVEVDNSLLKAWINLGAALQILGDLTGAAAACGRALQIDPDNANARCNLGLVQLLEGNYQDGLANCEQRFRRVGGTGLLRAQPPGEPWQGDQLPTGQPLLLVSEQGLGDTVQFMRYLPLLRRLGQQVELCAQEPLHGLVRWSGLDPAPLSPEQASRWQGGVWLPLLSLPRLLGVSAHDPLVGDPYLQAPPDRVNRWRRLLSAEARPILGLHWQGDPRQETTGLRGRSLPLESFSPLAAACGPGRLLSLQKGPGSEQLHACSFAGRFVHCQAEIDQTWDFLDALALIACCDLVITSDSCVAHLAGAMGHPTWLVLAKVPDWRWGLDGERTPWYPSLRLFRQRRAGDWAEVMERLVTALPVFLAGCGSGS